MHIVNKTLSGHHKYILHNFLLGLLKRALILQKLTLNPKYVTMYLQNNVVRIIQVYST